MSWRNLKKAPSYGGRNYKLHLDGYDQTALFTGKSDKSARNFVFYYDETVLTAIRYKQFKVTFSAKMDGHWDNPLETLGRPADHQSAAWIRSSGSGAMSTASTRSTRPGS